MGKKMKMEEGGRSVDDRYTQWKSLIPVLYDWLANHNLTDSSVPNTLVIANCEIVKPRIAAAEHISEFNEVARSPFVKKHKTIIHPGEVNRIRELPQNSKIVATHTDSPDVLIWDVEAQPNRQPVLGAAFSRPDLILRGHQENAEFALAMCPKEPFVLSGGKDKSVVLWSIHDHISTLALEPGATMSPGSSLTSTKSKGGRNNEKPIDGPVIGPRGIYKGHDDTVEDVQFCPSSSQEFCSVGDDSCLILWDARAGSSPAVKVEKAHNADIHCLDWNPHDANFILTGSADNTVHMFDRRNLTSGGVGSPVHKFEGHSAAVLCVQWSPDKSSVFGSSAEDGFLNIWDYEKIGKKQDTVGYKAANAPPGLFFRHAGHRDKVVDFHWNTSDPWTIASVSDDCGSTGGGGTLQGDPLYVKVNKLSSTKTQLPYDYYYLNYCKPSKILNNAENLGEVLRGDRIENSVYTFEMREDQPCKVVCRKKLDAESAKNFKEKIDDEYRVNMILDNLPVAVLRQRRDGSQSTTYEHGFRVGFKGNYAGSKEEKYFINNHLSFRVMFHRDTETDAARIVGFEVTPNSINHEYKEWDEKNPQVTTCNKDTKNLIQGSTVPQEVDVDKEVVFTYDVTFKESDIKWASRWDTYLLMNDDQIHWFSIINSLMIVLFLSGMVAMIMMRTLYKDIANYNQLETQDEAQEETGWKLVHGDVFRAPINYNLLCVYVGTGVQIFAMTLVTMIFAMLGFLSPSNRGGLMTAMVLLWVFMGLFAGYSSARLYKMFKGTEWKRNTLKTAFMFPGILFAVFFVLNALIWGEQSSGAVPFGTMFALVCLWFGISVPLVFVGSYLGFKKPAIEDPVKTNKIPRQIPEQAWYMKPVFSILIGGILPFGAVFIELFFILTSIWLNQFYYIFGFLFIVFVILIITCAEITIVLCYFQLCSEDYHWWWRSYLTAGSSALYLFLYSVFYFFTKLEITKLVSGILYFGYMCIVSYAFFVLTGTIGFYACFWFVRKIYSSVKID
ncbi:hypothetical protein CCACVL1_18656 [Corchorus capsularis]|uniref:Uncharacterized protein n=6 Tax=Spermatophyta TaxID=58024 RepID=A0A1R3HKC5_COCAP|nr:hypothetical protein CCACVL1_18656 [Corchorus capsularis]